MARSIEKLDFKAYDVVIVSSSGFAHGLKTQKNTKTIIYYHAPARYLWDWTHEYRKEIGMNAWIKWFLFGKLLLQLRAWDNRAAQNNDILLANSATTQKRIWKYFRRESDILYPPIETQRFAKNISHRDKEIILWQIFEKLSESEWNRSWVFWKDFQKIISQKNYYIILSALTEFKRLDVAINNFKHLPETNLVIIWKGEYKEHLEKLAGASKNIFFVGAQFWDDLVTLVQNSQWLIFPGEEDFGIVPIEIMAAGKPVFALKKWGLTETVLEWETWDFFYESEWSDFIHQFKAFHAHNIEWKYTAEKCKKRAKQYDESLFQKRILDYVQDSQ